MSSVVLIDDDIEFKDIFQIEAQQKLIKVIHKTSFDGLKQIMPAYERSVSAVVLDIKCLITDSQAKEDVGFIGTALKYLDTNCPGFPRLVLTGDDSAFEMFKSFFPEELVFQKTPQGLKEAFDRLSFYSENSEDLRIKRENSAVFSLFEKKYYDVDTEATLLNVLRRSNETSFPLFGGILRDVRSIQETIYKVIHAKNPDVVPKRVFKPNGMIRFSDLMRHLDGNPKDHAATTKVFQNSAISNLSISLYWTCGKYIHADPTETYFISNYSVKAMINSLMELFIWSERYVK